jgi:Major Facilitator Superfamily
MPTARMPRPTRLFLAGNTVSMAGIGLVIGFILIYLHQVRGLALPVVGGLFAASAAAGLLVVPILGILLDRLGARQVLTGIQLGQGTALVLLAWVHTAAAALPVMLLYGATWAPMFPALQTMIAGLTPDPAAQQRAFAINFTLQNAAIGVSPGSWPRRGGSSPSPGTGRRGRPRGTTGARRGDDVAGQHRPWPARGGARSGALGDGGRSRAGGGGRGGAACSAAGQQRRGGREGQGRPGRAVQSPAHLMTPAWVSRSG